MASHPCVTVLMPVYNGAAYLREAIESILGQTFRDFEFLIIDDGSSDESAAIAASYADRRIRLVANETNLGLPATLNRGLELAQGTYVARMDGDDISTPDRLERQVRYLERHPHVGILGTWAATFGNGQSGVWTPPTRPEAVACATVFTCIMLHPTVMLRRAQLRALGLRYDPRRPYAEDYGLWLNAMQSCALANLPRKLLRYRLHPTSFTRRNWTPLVEAVRAVQAEYFHSCGLQLAEEEALAHLQLGHFTAGLPQVPLDRVHAWLMKLAAFNRQSRVWPEPDFHWQLGKSWLFACLSTEDRTVRKMRRFLTSQLAGFALANELRDAWDHPLVRFGAGLRMLRDKWSSLRAASTGPHG